MTLAMNCGARSPGLLGLLIFVVAGSMFPPTCYAEQTRLPRNPIVIQFVHLDYADASYLAPVLAPLLSKEGKVVAYTPTNSLIIKDSASHVKRLVEIVKGRPDQ
jgi:hypothetical protein